MTLAAEKEYAHVGETQGAADHDHDMVHDLSKRLDALWRYDQYIANAKERPDLEMYWKDMRIQETKNVKRLKELLKDEIEKRCF